MNLPLAIPPSLCLLAMFALGAILGSLANLAIYRLAWRQRRISPWSAPDSKAPPRQWTDRVPILGWLGLSREQPLHGERFWIRPMLVELAMGVGLMALYGWEVFEHRLYPEMVPNLVISVGILHQQYFSHVVLITLMVAASLIDVDEMTIPDALTVPGTLVGLTLAAMLPWSLLPDSGAQVYRGFLTLASPGDWPVMFDGAPKNTSLAIGLACYWLWCFAILPRHWYGRHGLRRAMRVLTARLVRSLWTVQMLLLIALGTAAIAVVWSLGGEKWAGMLTALVGLAASGGVIWAVRLFAGAALGREAMGFGDVTLMMMIGTFLGWQACLLVFFLSPFAALAVTLLQKGLQRELEIPFGPYLCLAALGAMVGWATLWASVERYFEVLWLVPAVVALCVVLMALMLAAWRLILTLFFTKKS